jgi:hypothetical protein
VDAVLKIAKNDNRVIGQGIIAVSCFKRLNPTNSCHTLDYKGKATHKKPERSEYQGDADQPKVQMHALRLTFDMSGGWKRAQPAGNRPLDGGVRPQHMACNLQVARCRPI